MKKPDARDYLEASQMQKRADMWGVDRLIPEVGLEDLLYLGLGLPIGLGLTGGAIYNIAAAPDKYDEERLRNKHKQQILDRYTQQIAQRVRQSRGERD